MAVPLPPLNLNSSQRADSGAGQSMAGASWGLGSGDWVVNVPTSSGAGLSLMGGAGGGISQVAVIGIGVFALAALFLLRRKG